MVGDGETGYYFQYKQNAYGWSKLANQMKAAKANTAALRPFLNIIKFTATLIGFGFIIWVSAVVAENNGASAFNNSNLLIHSIILGVSFLATLISLIAIQRYPNIAIWKYIIFFLTVYFLIGTAAIWRVEGNARFLYIVYVYFGCLVFSQAWYDIKKRIRKQFYLVVPGGVANEVLDIKENGLTFQRIDAPEQSRLYKTSDGIVVDTKCSLDSSWVRFIAQAQLKKRKLMQAEALYEHLTGRLSLTHLSHGILSEIQPSIIYGAIKRLIDILLVCLSLPLTMLLMGFVSICIGVESKGPLIFSQKRIGQGGRRFTIYKFRSMFIHAENNGPAYASKDDERVTKIGRIIRTFRIDELPQFWNIMRGEMSLIGPRPEQVAFVERFNEDIPYYSYRHMVKPGITGWAQVSHGYTAGIDDTHVKLEHDLYYIKHFSFWLDMFIAIKTIKTILTGFGAR